MGRTVLQIQIELHNNLGFKWYSKDEVYVTGYLFDKEDNFFEKEKLINYFSTVKDLISLEKLLLNTNGFFSIIIKSDDTILIAVDRLRSIPLFYKHTNDLFLVSDSISQANETIDKNSPEYYEFLMSGYTINETTLLSTCKQVQASEIVQFVNSKNEVNRLQYFKHTHQNYFDIDYKKYYKDLNKITDDFIKRLINSVGDKTIVIPLSGGYDSRYILSGLKKLIFKNVICYTYGTKDSFEISIAKKVAKILGYKIYTLDYTDEKWGKLLENEMFFQYINYSFNYTSLPHIQDFIALDELSSKELIPKDSVIVPGFCGDLLGGSYVPAEIKKNEYKSLHKEGIIDYVYRKHFDNMTLPIPDLLRVEILNKIKYFIGNKIFSNTEDFISYNESFFTEHKVSKFVVNALRPYEFFGYEWRMPLWDNELMEYWYRVPYELRIDGTLYNNFLFDNLFDKQHIGFRKIKPISHSRLFMIIKRVLPIQISRYLKIIYKYLLQKYSSGDDINNFNIFGNNLLEDLEQAKHIKFNHINGLFAYWLLEKWSEK